MRHPSEIELRVRRTTTMRRGCRKLGLFLAAVLFAATGLGCPPDPDLSIENHNRMPTRLAQGSGGRFFVTDAVAGSVFIYSSDLTLQSELKDLDRPLAVAVDKFGKLYVGSNGRNSVEVYDHGLHKLWDIGQGQIQMPTDIAIDNAMNLYIVDSLSDTVWVYRPNGSLLRSIGSTGTGDGELRFPSAVTVAYPSAAGELFVADQANSRVQVFTLEGDFLRGYGEPIEAFSQEWEGRFVNMQSLAVDIMGRLHVADSYLNRVQILDPSSGAFIDSYGEFGTAAGELNVPLDLHITQAGEAVVTNSGNHRVEVVYEVTER